MMEHERSTVTAQNAAHHQPTADANENVMSPQFPVIWPRQTD